VTRVGKKYRHKAQISRRLTNEPVEARPLAVWLAHALRLRIPSGFDKYLDGANVATLNGSTRWFV
jgi:hypothetical protein